MLKPILPLLMFSIKLISQQSVDAVLASYKGDKDLQHAAYSFCVLDATSGKTIKEFNSELALIPASTLKIVTTGAALGLLGKNYVYKTNFYTSNLTDSVLGKTTSNLLIQPSGDPTFNSSYFYKSDSVFLNGITSKLKTKGLKTINGAVIITNSVFDNEIPNTWIWGDIGNYFGAGATSLSYKDNKFSVYFLSGDINTKATMESVYPACVSKKIQITSDVNAFGADDNAIVYGDPNGYVRFISGTIPKNKTHYLVEAQLPNPALFFAEELSAQLQKQNILLKTSAPIVTASKLTFSTTNLLYTHQSATLNKIIYYTNLKSDNHYAESLLKTLGTKHYTQQGTTDSGISVVKNYWEKLGVNLSGLHMVDGSGLSRENTITTKIQATILSKIYCDTLIYNSFNESLPIAGKSGSMVNLCKATFAENNMRAKTGYINRVRGYCGYVKTKGGKELAFSVLFNNYNCSAKDMKLKIEKLLVALVDL